MQLPFSKFVNNLLISINRDPDQLNPIGGWLNVTIFEVACRIAGVEPSVSLFSALFTVTHEDIQTTFRARRHRNILVGKSPNKDEAKSLPLCTEVDIRTVEKIRTTLPQETKNKKRLSSYAFVDEAMLVLAGLVYDKEFDPEAKDDPPTWGELLAITSANQMDDVEFDAMLSEKPSFLDRVKIKSKTKPRESMVPSDFAPAAPFLL
ncbi:hypothetical protein LIER_24431 [Lithospermum erythrorhizon]|uniref:Transposase (putative) gypsy type domain-containing protein n=1 Tax=Lithospermum erythrorhizon TaxID=34254 RepID=A0AAV3R4D3_LITER